MDECASPFSVKTRFDARVEEDRVGVFRGVNPAELLEGLQVEHHDRLVVAGGREPVAGGRRQRGAVGALDAGHFAQHLPVVLVHDHDPVLAADEEPVIRRVGHDVVPAAVAADHEGVRDAIRRGRLRQQRREPRA